MSAADFAGRLAELSPKKRELLLKKLGAAETAVERIPRVSRATDRFPVSAAQLREWILDRLQPGTAAFNIPGGGRVVGALDLPALLRAVGEIVRRHESLRTTFSAGEGTGEPLQVVSADLALPAPLIDVSALPPAPREEEGRRLAQEEADAPFDLERGPLLRVRLVRLAPQEHLVLYTMHHIVSDGWSSGIFLRELGTLYEAFSTGLPSPLPELPVQYADFAVWQRQRLDGGGLEGQLAYWQRQLAGVVPLDLPTDRPRPAVQEYHGGRHILTFPPPRLQPLRDLAKDSGASLFMALLAVYATLLSRLSGQDDLTVGTFSGSRNRTELEGLIGFFINNLVLRLDVAGLTLRGLLARARDVVLDAFAHQDVPFERVLDAVKVERDLSRTPLFQAMLVLQSYPSGAADLSHVRIEPVALEHERADFDLTFWLAEVPQGLVGNLSYSRALFDAATIERWGGTFEALLGADPDVPVAELPILSPAEREQLLTSWAHGPIAPAALPVHVQFRAAADRYPDTVALAAGEVRLTYTELATRVSERAAHLRALGVGPETLVGVAADREAETIIDLFAILEAGGAYLPLDPALPAARRETMLADAGSPLVLSASSPFESSVVAGPAAGLGNAAYVIFTSGSTGKPKGVVVEHRSLAAYVAGAVTAFGLGPGDRVLQFASLSFDTAGEEIYPALASGATLVLRSEEAAASVPDFLAEVERLGVTVLDLPTAFWHELVLALGPGLEVPACVRLVILGGEKALPERVAAWQERAGARVRLVNTYGPTEATIVATRCDLSSSAAPIGRPIPGASVYVMDRAGLPAPTGVTGELWIGGEGLARGYLGRPEATAERFVPSPFGPPGARLYRSGDLVRFTPDGTLHYLGRADHQVKLRGYRIELGEIETALRRHPAVRDAAVAVRKERLAAWVAADALPADLKPFLEGILPAYMVPASYLALPALPKTTTGKVDRRALPDPEATAAAAAYVPPGTATERAIAAVWCEVLGAERVGREDNFFDLGGHSLLVVRAHARLRETLGRDISVIDLFRHPTVAALARHLEQGEERPAFQQVEALAAQQKAALARQRQAMERLRKTRT